MKPIDRLGFGPSRTERKEGDTWIVKVTPPFDIGPGVETRLSEDQFARYQRWRQGGILIQNALPDLSMAEREQLITGLSPEAFSDMARSEDE